MLALKLILDKDTAYLFIVNQDVVWPFYAYGFTGFSGKVVVKTEGHGHIEVKLVSDGEETGSKHEGECKILTPACNPGIAALTAAGRLVIGNDQGTFGRRRLLAKLQCEVHGRMTFRHKNEVLTQEKRYGRDFIQGILISFEG
jgi:hypothetical protein